MALAKGISFKQGNFPLHPSPSATSEGVGSYESSNVRRRGIRVGEDLVQPPADGGADLAVGEGAVAVRRFLSFTIVREPQPRFVFFRGG